MGTTTLKQIAQKLGLTRFSEKRKQDIRKHMQKFEARVLVMADKWTRHSSTRTLEYDSVQVNLKVHSKV